MVESAPSAVDLQEFQFKYHSKLKIFDYTDESKFKKSCNLIASASRYGLVVVGSPNATLEVIQLKSIENTPVAKTESSNFPKRSISLGATPSHLAVNCDHTLLAVICYKNECATAIIYNVTSFLSQNVVISREIRVSATPGVQVLEATWNPTMPGVLTTCKADGSLGVYNINENSVDINELPVAASARCFCWSPKGKQLVVGSTNGSLTQYKPDLKAVKVIPAPALAGTGPFSALSVCWVSNYQFIAVYRDVGNEDARPCIVVVNAPKAGPTLYVNYDDICFSYGTLRSPQYYIINQQTWGILLVSSANSMELGVMGINSPTEPALWTQWNQNDAARAELPLSPSHQETFPVGISLDTGVTLQLPWGENQTLHPMPFLHILSHHGVLCTFSVINIREGAQCVCSPPESVTDLSGLGMFKITAPAASSSTASVSSPVQQPTPTPTSTQSAVSIPTLETSGALTPLTQQSIPVPQIKPQPNPLQPSAQPAFGSLASGAPTLAFGSLTTKPQLPFGVPSSISSIPSPTMNVTSSVIPASSAAPMGSLPGWTSGSTLFGATPNFGNLATPQATATANFKVPSTSNTSDTSKIATHVVASSAALSPVVASSSAMSLGSTASSLTSATPTMSGLFAGMPTATAPASTPSFFGGTAKSTTMFNTPSNFGVLNITSTKTQSGAIAPVQSMPTNIPAPSQPSIPVSKPLLSTPKTVPKPDILPSQPPSQQPQNETINKKDETTINDQMMQSLIKEEVKNFQTELHELFQRCKNIKLDVGSEEEKTNLVLATESLLEFHKELQDTTDSQVAEVHYLKQALMQTFAWYEDAKARHRRYTDPNFASLLQAQELDPISEKQLADIKHLIYYIEAQLKQVDGFLDNQWADFQDSCKKHVKGKLQIPTLEPIYQALVRQNAILERHKYLLKDIAARIKSRNKKAAAYPHVMNLSLSNSKANIEIDKELQKLKIDHTDLFSARYDRILAQQKKFTENKESKLCTFFTNRTVLHISARKPKFVNSSLIAPSKFHTSPGAQRNLAQAFNKLDSSFNNSGVEANLSASNLFSFTLLDNVHSTKISSPEKPAPVQQPQQKAVMNLIFNTPKPVESSKLDVTNISTATKNSPNLYNLPSTPGVSSTSVFNFTAVSTAITHSKPVMFGPGDMNTSLMFSGATAKTTQAVTKFGLSSQITQSKSTDTQAVSKPSEVALIKPTVQKTTESPTLIGGLTTSTTDTKPQTQPFNFVAPQNKPVTSKTVTSLFESNLNAASKSSTTTINSDSSLIVSKPNVNMFAGPRDSIEPGFSFGSALSLGQQSTPKPKTSGTLAFTQMLPPVSTNTSISTTLAKSITPVTTIVATNTAVTTQAVAFKANFGIAQSVASISPITTSVITSAVSSANNSKSESSIPTTSGSITNAFASLSTDNKTTGIFFGQQTASSSSSTLTSGNIFGGNQSNSVTSSSLFGGKPSSDPEKSALFPVASSPAVLSTTATTISSGFSFTQTANNDVIKTGSIFGGTATSTPTLFDTAVTANVTAASSSSVTGFSFLQSAATATAAGTVGSPVTTTTAPKTSSIFAPTTEIKPAEQGSSPTVTTEIISTVSSAPGVGESKASQNASSFSFTDNNKFSFGNLTVTALSPPTTTTSSTNVTTTTTTTGFGFGLTTALASTTVITTTTSAFSGFGSNLFSKPATATTTTASSFMGQPICSPSSFTKPQNSGSIFGQNTGNIFVQKPVTTNSSSGSIFGQSSTTFGQTSNNPTTTTSTSIFAQAQQSSPFGGAPTATSATGGSIFGQSFAFAANPAATTSGSIFGQSAFGSPSATSSSSSFSFTQNTSTSNFGNSGGNIFGSKSTFGAAPAFGQAPTFGAPPAFGGTPATGNVFSSPSQTSYTGIKFGTGFGSPSSFGQKPTFGSPPSFGQSAFGSPPAFGSSPSFGSPQRVFGSTTSPATGTFGSTVQENSTFANLANQSTIGFGSLVQNQPPQQQQQQQQQPPQFSGGTQFSSWR